MRDLRGTPLLIRDELIGFARSKVMLVLWVILPVIAVGGYLLLSGNRALGAQLGGGGGRMTATTFMSFLLSSLAGTVAALMVAVDLVSERQRKVYELFVIRPIRREAIIWAKFVAVFACVTVAAVVSLALGVLVDAVRGHPPTADGLVGLVKALASLTGVIALSASVGVFFGVVSRSILIAVILVLYLGQNLAVVPMLPMYLGILPDAFWIVMAITAALVATLVWLAGRIFQRTQF
jgi:ABC-type transport system involved in multi-copper enzyme maturation permease subunit